MAYAHHTLFLCVVFLGFVTGSSLKTHIQALQKYILGRLDRFVPPYPVDKSNINVTMAFSPITVFNLDSVTQVLSMSGYLGISWQDEELTWNSSDYGGHERLEVEPNAIWKPKISLINSIVDLEPISTSTNLDVFNGGLILWRIVDVFRTSCKINVKKYPFDIQVCKLVFVSTAVDGIQLFTTELRINLNNLDINDKNGEWMFVNASTDVVPIAYVRRDAAVVSITLQRKYTYYVINIIFPMSLMSVLNPCVFLIPSRSGEKLAFLMAVFVSHSMFLTLIHQTIPPTSDHVSKLSMFVTLLEVQGFLTILATIAVLDIHHRQEKAEIPTRNDAVSSSDENSNEQVPVKSRKSHNPCGGLSWEMWMDRIFFVLSLGLSLSSNVIWWKHF